MAKKTKKGWSHKVKSVSPNTRITDYAGQIFPTLGSKSAAKKAISAGRLYVNQQIAKTGHFVVDGDLIEIRGSSIKAVKQYNIDLPVVFQDDFLIIINKPGGIAVNGNRFKTVENALAKINLGNRQPDALPRPVAVHRIDLPTTGLVMLAKTKTALIKMGKAFQQNKVNKTYHALAHGEVPEKGEINTAIDGKKALTKYERITFVPSRVFGKMSYVSMKPVTGRTHQLRKHLLSIGCPIAGDKMYAKGVKTIQGKGLFLCSCKMEFTHPVSGKRILAEVDFPRKFVRIMTRETDRF